MQKARSPSAVQLAINKQIVVGGNCTNTIYQIAKSSLLVNSESVVVNGKPLPWHRGQGRGVGWGLGLGVGRAAQLQSTHDRAQHTGEDVERCAHLGGPAPRAHRFCAHAHRPPPLHMP